MYENLPMFKELRSLLETNEPKDTNELLIESNILMIWTYSNEKKLKILQYAFAE